MKDGLTFVTVVFDAEITLLELQARSMAMHLDRQAAASVMVLDNSVSGLSRGTIARLRRAYGPLQDRMRVVRTRELIDSRGVSGWRSQQAAKLVVSQLVDTRHYVVLDAKNHFISPAGVASFVGEDGRAHAARHSYASHPLRPALARTLDYVGATPETRDASIDAFPPTATPFVFDTALVRALVEDVRARSGRRFEEEFEAHELLEFFLYSSWLEVRGPGVDAVMDGRSLPSPTVWPKAATVAGVDAAIAEIARDGAFVFAVHRQVLARADRATRDRIAAFWAERGLLPDTRAATRLIADFRRRYFPALVRTRLDERVQRRRRRAGA